MHAALAVFETSAVVAALCCCACGGSSAHSPLDPTPESSAIRTESVVTSGAARLAPPGPPTPPRSPIELLEVLPGYPRANAVAGVCPPGTQLAPPGTTCADLPKRGAGRPPSECACEYVCTPGCGAGEVCAPDESGAGAACRCHGALEPSEDGCTWVGLLPNPSFEDASGWNLWTSGVAGGSRANVVAGKLELEVTSRCSYAAAGAAGRYPARSQFPEGAALVVTYAASGGVLAGSSAILGSGFESLGEGSVATGEVQQSRSCVQLREVPWLGPISFSVYAFGVCSEPSDYQLWVDDIRLESDPDCR